MLEIDCDIKKKKFQCASNPTYQCRQNSNVARATKTLYRCKCVSNLLFVDNFMGGGHL